MPQNLFAACRDNGNLEIKRIRLDATVQQAVADVFNDQEQAFRAGIQTEVPFDGSWTPDEDELLTIPTPQEALVFGTTLQANATTVPDLNTASFQAEGVKAVFTGEVVGGQTKVLLQAFDGRQMLERKFALLQRGNAFRRLTDPAFTLDTSLTCIIEGGLVKFKSQHKLRSIIDMMSIYRAATDQEVQAFAAHPALDVGDVAAFVDTTNVVSRKLIHAITNNGTLNAHTPIQIQQAAQATGLAVTLQNNRIVMPTAHADIKALLQFLNESRYSGPLSGTQYVTNSRRPA